MTDTKTVRLVIIMLGLVALFGLAGLVALLLFDKPTDAVALVGTITGGAVGSLGTLLASTRSVDVAGLQALAAADPAGQPDPPPPV